MDRKQHWDKVFATKNATGTSWFQKIPVASLKLIENAGLATDAAIIDVGAGTATLVDHLLTAGYLDLTVLDISGFALDIARLRLSNRAGDVKWIEADVTRFPGQRRYALWHDRAVFHFLTDPADREAYRKALENHLQPRAHLIIGVFAPDGPARCSGLDVSRYGADDLQRFFGSDFDLVDALNDIHLTPAKKRQNFIFCHFRRK
ncbi:MAG: class I SAM-dependent methyltransferase [Magnetococcales bacterium]|nr:class I SAM-dependent methyltransferase [Magnetococcales bacterium]